MHRMSPTFSTAHGSQGLARVRRVLALGFIAIYFGLLAASLQASTTPPSLGLEAAWDRASQTWIVSKVQPISTTSDAGIDVGSIILRVDGQPVPTDETQGMAAIQSATRITVLDPTSQQELTADAQARQPNRAMYSIIGTVTFLVGMIALIWGRGQAPRALALVCCSGGTELTILPATYSQAVWALVLHSHLVPLAIISLAYLSLVFPVARRPRIGRWHIPLRLIPLSALPVGTAMALSTQVFPGAYQAFRPVLFSYFVLGLGVTCIASIYTWWTSRTSREGTQLRIVTLGSLFAILPFLLLNILPRTLFGRDLVQPELTLPALVIMPAAFAYAILRYQIMDLRLYIRRGVVYSALVALITGTYFLLLLTMTLFLRDRAGISNILAVALITAIFAIGGDRIRSLVQTQVDRLFDRRSYDYRQQLLEFSQQMNRILDPDELANTSVELVAQTMGPSFVRLYLYDPNTGAYDLWTSAGIPVPSDQTMLGAHHPIVESMQEQSEPVQHFDVAPEDTALTIPLLNKGQPVALLTLGPKQVDLPYTSEDLSLLRTVANNLAIATENAQLYGRMRDLYLSGIRTLAATVDAKDPYTHGHSERVAAYARAIAVEMGLPQFDVETIELAGLLHDIGKIGVPDIVLQKPGRLDPDERAMIMEHASLGAKILSDNIALLPLVPLVRHHHEWYNGNGYPDGLAGQEIPLGAAIISVADTYDTMTTDRPYRKAPGTEKARAEILRCSGTQFHPKVVEAFLRVLGKKGWPEQPVPSRIGAEFPNRDPMAGRITAVDSRAMHIVYKVAQMIGGVTDLKAFIASVTELLRREIGVGQLEIYLVDPETGDLYGQTPAPGAVTGIRVPASEGLIGWVAEHQVSARVDDVANDSRTANHRGDERSAMAVPLVIDDRTIGVIAMESRRVGVFTEDDEALLTIVGQQLAQVIEVAQLHDHLKRSAMLDSLTGVANHRTFYERLEVALEHAQRTGSLVALIMIDVDELKLINDTHGHVVGDAALRALAHIIQREARMHDTVARYGGYEFAVILPGLGEAAATQVAERIVRSLSTATIEANGVTVPLPQISWGVVTFPDDGDRAMTLVAAADERMYRHKARHPAWRDRFTLYAD